MVIYSKTKILSYHKMMNLCHDFTGSELLKMYPTMTKVELKELNKLREKFGKTLPNRSKQTIDDVVEQTTKRVTPPKLQKQPSGMLPPRPIHSKEREVYELNNDEDFSPGHNAKTSTIFHLSYILFISYKLIFAMVSIGMFLF